MSWNYKSFGMTNKSKEEVNEPDRVEYMFPESTQNRLEVKADEMGISTEDLLTLMIEVSLAETKDLREIFVSNELEILKTMYSKEETLQVEDTIIYFDKVEVSKDIDKETGKYAIIIDYYLGGNKIASRVERPLERII